MANHVPYDVGMAVLQFVGLRHELVDVVLAEVSLAGIIGRQNVFNWFGFADCNQLAAIGKLLDLTSSQDCGDACVQLSDVLCDGLGKRC